MPYEGYEPPAPPQPPKPPQPPAEAPQPELTAAQQAGFFGETKESGSDPTRGEKHWDPQWEKRARKILGSDVVGGLGDLYDPEHRRWLNKQLRKAKGKGKGKDKAATQPVEEAADVPEAAGGADDGGPVAQGSADQYKDLTAGTQLGHLFPERQVPGGDQDQAMPGGNIDKDQEGRQDGRRAGSGEWYDTGTEYGDRGGAGPAGDQTGGAGEPYQTGVWTPEDEARSRDATAGTQSEAFDTGLWTGPSAGGDPGQSTTRLPSRPWPPDKYPTNYYTGGM